MDNSTFQVPRMLSVICVIITILFFMGCDNPFAKDYQLFVYPNKNNLTKHIIVGHFDSLESARDEADFYMRKYPNGDYEIGIDCKPDGEMDIYICKETIR